MPKGKKQAVIAELFELCKRRGNFEFDNELVKQVTQGHEFRNQFDVTKLDNSDKLPQALKDEDYFIAHLGGGKHRFIKGISSGYHSFESIQDAEIINWQYRPSVLNESDSSEANILSVASNQRIIHDFLYKDIVANPKFYIARRTKTKITYWIRDVQVVAQNLQIEIDLTAELDNLVTVFEGKNGFPRDFAVYQLFHPFKYYNNLKNTAELDIRQVTCCYILRGQVDDTTVLRLYNYTFTDENKIDSIRLIKKSQYRLVRR